MGRLERIESNLAAVVATLPSGGAQPPPSNAMRDAMRFDRALLAVCRMWNRSPMEVTSAVREHNTATARLALYYLLTEVHGMRHELVSAFCGRDRSGVGWGRRAVLSRMDVDSEFAASIALLVAELQEGS